jgi:large repetitive protein
MKKHLLFLSSDVSLKPKTKVVSNFLLRFTAIPLLLLGLITNSFAQSPGGVAGASVWLKANAGTSTTTDGASIATWNDQSGNNRTHTQPNGTVYQPQYKDNVFNYNPAAYFDGLDGMQTAAFASGSDAVHVFAMSKVKDNGWRSIYGFGRDASHVQWYNHGLANKPSVWLSANDIPATALGLNYGVTSYILPKDGSQKTVNWNGTSGNITGINNYSYNSLLMSVGTDISNYGAFSENFLGDIAEVIIYKKAGGGTMPATDIQKIQSYLGIKYGITLSHDYLDATGSTVYALGTYNKNVFGIAREDAQGLYQKQSKSYDANAYVTLSTGALTTSNANNTGTLANQAFEIVGDNGLSNSFGVTYAPSTFTPTTAFYRMARVWQVQETGTVGTVRITVPTGADRLLVSNSATFTPGASTQELTLTADGNGGQYVDVDLNNTTNKFFTFGKAVSGPGCVAGGPDFWFDPAQNVTKTGATVTGWTDADGSGNNPALVQATAALQPSYSDGDALSNFNPYINFTGNERLNTSVTGANYSSNITTFGVVNKLVAKGSYNNFIRFTDTDNSDAGTHNWGLGTSDLGVDKVALHYISAPFAAVAPGNIYNRLNGTKLFELNTPTIMSGSANATTGASSVGNNGNEAYGTGKSGIGTFVPYNFLTVGGGNAYGMNNNKTQEIVHYARELTIQERQKVNTYMAIKYGITLDTQDNSAAITEGDYILGDGTTKAWNKTANTTYHNNVFGIGRDDCQGLMQKQSKSVNDAAYVTISNATTVAATNSANPSIFTADKSFDIIGDNGLAASYATAYTPTTFTPAAPFYSMSRIWKVQETGTVGTVTISVPAGAERLLVFPVGTTNFASGAQEILMTSDGNGNVTAQVDLMNGQLFTFGKALTAPGCVATGLDFWFDPARNVTKTGSVVTGWADADGSGNNPALVQATAALQPAYSEGDALSNFNPYINFTGNERLNTGITGANYSSNITTFGVVNKLAAKGSYNNFIRLTDTNNSDAGTHNWGLGTSDLGEDKVALHYISAPFAAVAPGNIYNRLNGTKLFTLNTPTIMSGSANATTGASSVGNNGNEAYGTGKSGIGTFVPYNFMTVGGGNAYGMNNNKTQEIIHYSRELTIQERQRVNTYLAIKYGITLDIQDNSAAIVEGDYIMGDGTTKIWDKTASATYHNNVFGIGREDCQGLIQKQSKSVNAEGLIAIGIDNQIAATNIANLGAFDTDKSFLIIGDNGATAGTLTTVTPGGACSPPETVDKFTSRVWKSVETGSVESTKLSVDLSSYGFSTVNPVYMQVASDAAFTSFSNILMVKNGMNYETNYDFAGTQYIRFAGTTALPPANACSGDKTYEWNSFPSYWTWGQMSRTSTFGDTQFAVTITDPNGAIYAPTVYPVGQWWWNHIFIPRYDANGSSNKITTKIVMDKAANKASFEIFDIDEYFGKDVVNVYGKLGGVQVNPKITFPTTTKLTSTISGTGAKISATTGAWDISAYGKAYVNFNSAVDEIIIEYTKDNGWAFKSYQDIRIRNIDITCKPFVPEAPLADNVYMSKQVVGGTNQKVDEAFTYKLTLTNLDCGNKTINILDGLPSGLKYVDSTLATSLASTSVSAYGGSSTLNMTGVVVPPGTSYIYVDAKGAAAGTYDNQVDFTVGSNSYLSDDPAQTGASNPTPVTLVANRPLANLVITKTVDKASAGQNEVIKYTYKIDNPNGSAILTTFQDNLPASTAGGAFKYVAGSLTNIGAAIVAPAVYGGESSLTLRNLSIPANGSLTFTVDANTGTFTTGQTGQNVASVTPDPGTIYRDIPYYSAPANTLIGTCLAGTTAPTLSATTKSNVCPATTTDLTSLVTSSCPVGSALEWHNVNTGFSAGSKVVNPVSASGTYYPTCFDNTNTCYSPAPATGVTVTIKLCFTGSSISGGTVAQTATPSQSKSGNAATDLVPTGGNGSYTYSNGTSDPACTAPSGATPLPGASNLTITNPATGAYTYTAPSTPGTYYFCIKVCDTSSPTPVCTIATYTVTVAAVASAGTVDCSKTQIIAAPIAGTAGQHTLVISLNTTTIGCFPLTVSGSGMSLANGVTTICSTALGVKSFSIPIEYDGGALGTLSFTIGSAGTCTADLLNVTPKKVAADVWTLDNCTLQQAGPQLK